MSADDRTNEMTNEELVEDEEPIDEEEYEDEEEGMSPLSELFGDDEEDCEEAGDEVPISKVITEIAQPVKITTSVGAEVDSKGQIKPNCKFTIERSITTDDNEYEIMATDFDALIDKVKATIAALKGGN